MDRNKIQLLIDTNILIYALNGEPVSQAFVERNLHRAATVQVHDLTLITRNLRDFMPLDNLKLHNPFDHV